MNTFHSALPGSGGLVSFITRRQSEELRRAGLGYLGYYAGPQILRLRADFATAFLHTEWHLPAIAFEAGAVSQEVF